MNTESANTQSPNETLPFQKVSSTRWLVRGKAMYNLLVNWETLKADFTCFEQNYARNEVKYKARMIKEIQSDYKNYLYLLHPLFRNLRVNNLFQSTKQDPHVLQKELFMHRASSKDKIYDANGNQKCCIIKFLTECSKYTERIGKFEDVKRFEIKHL